MISDAADWLLLYNVFYLLYKTADGWFSCRGQKSGREGELDSTPASCLRGLRELKPNNFI